MKQLILTAAIFLMSIAASAQTKTVNAFFVEFDAESSTFSFEEANGDYITFDKIAADVLAKFPLKSAKLAGKSYTVTYTVKTLKDEDDYEYEELTITKLVEIKLKREVSDDDED